MNWICPLSAYSPSWLHAPLRWRQMPQPVLHQRLYLIWHGLLLRSEKIVLTNEPSVSLCKLGVIRASPTPSKKGCTLNGFQIPRLDSWLSQTTPSIKAYPVCPTKYPGPMLLCGASGRMRDQRLLISFWSQTCIFPYLVSCALQEHIALFQYGEKKIP